jgi:small subunit ribosomal protein S6
MAKLSTTYDLVLLLDPQAEESSRAKVLEGIRQAISQQGELVRHDQWGERQLAYQIKHRASAEYHLLQFHSSTPELISGLSRTLHITDEIVRYRINKLKPGTPEPPDVRAQRQLAAEQTSEPEPAEH